MKILFILNNYFGTGNGLAASARRTVKALRDAGEEVRVVSGPNSDPDGPKPDRNLITSSSGFIFLFSSQSLMLKDIASLPQTQ